MAFDREIRDLGDPPLLKGILSKSKRFKRKSNLPGHYSVKFEQVTKNVMNTIEIDSKKIRAPKDAYRILEENGLKEGDEVRVSSKEEMVLALVYIAIVLYFLTKKSSSPRNEFGEQVLKDLFSNKSSEQIEKEIEKEYGINVETGRNPKDEEKVSAADHLERIAQKGALKKTIPDPLRWQKEQREDRSL